MSKTITFLKENGPIITVLALIVVIALVVPLSPKSLWKLEAFAKSSQQQNLETTEGKKEVLVALEMEIDVPDGFTFRASAIERLRGDLHVVRSEDHIHGITNEDIVLISIGRPANISDPYRRF